MYSISYPVTPGPLYEDGSFHDKIIDVGLPGMAFRVLGGLGAMFSVGSDEVLFGVANEMLDTVLFPTVFTA